MKERIYFPNLNSVRFIAATLVVVNHSETIKKSLGLDNYLSIPFIASIGRLGVVLFFVLSGFLITYLLLEEKQRLGQVDIKYFYARRVLRIWPLYYIIVLLCFFVFPIFTGFYHPEWPVQNEHFFSNFLMYLFFLPNVAVAMHRYVPFISQAWSVGVEEQFYLYWPWLIRYVKHVWLALTLVLVSYVVILLCVRPISLLWFDSFTSEAIYSFWLSYSISSMAIGGIYAYVLHSNKTRLLSIMYNRVMQLSVVLVMSILIVTGFKFPFLSQEIYATFFGFVILNLAANPNRLLTLEFQPLNYLGKISYGIYMYHPVVIVLLLHAAPEFSERFTIPYYLVLMICIALVAATSYELLEKRFIRIKLKYSHVTTGDNVKV